METTWPDVAIVAVCVAGLLSFFWMVMKVDDES